MNQMTSFFPSVSSIAGHSGSSIALISKGKEISYSDLSLWAQSLAAQLLRHGVERGDLAAVHTTSSLTIYLALYATLYLGVTIFPLDPFMSRGRRERLLAQAGCSLVLTDIDLEDLPQWVNAIQIAYPYASDGVMGQHADGGAVQLIIATSGSEGEPKGVMLSGGNIASSVGASRDRLGLERGDIWLNCLPMFHIGGIMIAYRCLDAGAGMLLHSGFDADRVWADLNDYPVTHISLVPAMLDRLLDASGDATPPDSLRVALIGGGHLAPELAARAHAAGWPLCASYGMSESCSQCATDCGAQAGTSPGMVGMPLDGFEIALSQRGRIRVRGPAVMLGYANPDLSPGQGLSDVGWFETGDLGEIGESGRIRVLGRADDMLICGGVTIHPGEIEGQVYGCPGVGEVAVTSRSDPIWGDLLVAMYTGEAGKDDVESWCRANLASVLRPREFIRVSDLPRNGMGKLDRVGLRGMLAQE